jgi:hypothetical protein
LKATFRWLICLSVFAAAACGAPARPTATQNAPTLVAPTLPPTVALVTQAPETSPTQLPVTVPPEPPTQAPPSPTSIPTQAEPPTQPAPPANPTPVALSEGALRIFTYNPNRNRLLFYDLDGNAEESTVGAARALAIPCLSYEDNLVLHFGSDTSGTQAIYPLSGGAPLSLGQNHGLACSLRDRMQLSADGNLFGVLSYRADATRGLFAIGALRVLELPTLEERVRLENVNSFTFRDREVAVVQFFTDARGDVPSVDVRVWNGERTQRLVSELPASEGCTFVSSTVRNVSEALFIAFGERCSGRPSQWRVVRVTADGAYVEIGKGNSGGTFLSFSALNQLHIISPTEALLVYPNGLDASVANVGRLSLETGELRPVLNAVVIERHPPDLPRRFLFNTDGSWLAMVTRSGNGDEQLHLYAVDRDEAPVPISTASRGARILAVAWSADGTRLFYTTGGATDALYSVSIGDLRPRLIARGRFQGLVITPGGDLAVLAKQVQSGRDLLNHLVAIETADGNERMIVEGQKDEAAVQPLAIR